jgi:hypothetical protein
MAGPEEGEDPLGELEAVVAALCGHDWAGFGALSFREQLAEHQRLTQPLIDALARLAAQADVAVAPRLTAQADAWWERLKHATEGVRFTPITHPWHWYTRLIGGAHDVRYAAARRALPDACECQLADAAGLSPRPPAVEQLEELARGLDEDLPWPAPWVEYRCRCCGAYWRMDDASTENWSAVSWQRLGG